MTPRLIRRALGVLIVATGAWCAITAARPLEGLMGFAFIALGLSIALDLE